MTSEPVQVGDGLPMPKSKMIEVIWTAKQTHAGRIYNDQHFSVSKEEMQECYDRMINIDRIHSISTKEAGGSMLKVMKVTR